MKPSRPLAVAVTSCCALLAWAGTATASARPVGVAHAPTAAAGTAPGKRVALPRGRHGPAPAKAKSSYAGVDRQSPVAVGEAFARATYTFDTAAEASTNPATARSTVWCTPSLEAKMLASLPEGSPGAQWIEWTAHKAVTTVAVRWAPDPGAPHQTTTAAYESYDLTVRPHGEHGWTGAPDYYVMWVTLSRTGAKAPWEVADFEVQQWWPSTGGE